MKRTGCAFAGSQGDPDEHFGQGAAPEAGGFRTYGRTKATIASPATDVTTTS